jgi:flagellum-specific ATP synthase
LGALNPDHERRWDDYLAANAHDITCNAALIAAMASTLALDATTGKIKGYFHYTPNELLDPKLNCTMCCTEIGPVVAEVVAVRDAGLVCMPLGELRGVRAGDRAHEAEGATSVPVGRELLGRVLDGLGRPIDGGPSLRHVPQVMVDHAAPHPLTRRMIDEPLPLGVRALDTLVPCGRGQRMGIFAGSGVGKSTLLSMITRGTEAAVTVLALVGERGREVREFIENDLGPEGLRRSVVVVATSDAPALVRLRAAFTATRIAESFRDDGADVLLLMDSLTRFAMAQREVGLSAGEPPATRGYPPSVFAMLPRLLERAGAAEHGSITGRRARPRLRP